MAVLGIVFVGAFGRSGIESQARVIERFEAHATGVIAHYRVRAQEFEKSWPFELRLIGSGDSAQNVLLCHCWETHEVLTVSLDRERIYECQSAAELELNIAIMRHHVIDELDDTGIVRARVFIARNDEFGKLIKQAVFGRGKELWLIVPGFRSG